ncbi:hypothetical protein PHLCEN_2v11373 [Hermanssonia centrifuga]|uniref:Uncharacterized protein n=1 Tax=Hermanssonia centrifuga TaxID=98765 RepID=A0A2R6NK69_9APHY|nr:hypothetical protein PHLCEN_2v11373 [Hermanssonia centrifuga]
MASTNDVNATNDNVTLNTETIAPDTQSPGSSRDNSPEFDTLFVPPKDFVFKTPEMPHRELEAPGAPKKEGFWGGDL